LSQLKLNDPSRAYSGASEIAIKLLSQLKYLVLNALVVGNRIFISSYINFKFNAIRLTHDEVVESNIEAREWLNKACFISNIRPDVFPLARSETPRVCQDY
jgi:hypothetical protein